MSLSSNMKKALDSDAGVQSQVRDLLATSDDALAVICEEIGVFKTEVEASLNGLKDTEAVQTYRKKANNIINDVSRICQKEAGVSIKCKSRKDGYVYEACDYVPRTKSTPATPFSEPASKGEIRLPIVEWPEGSKAWSDASEIDQTVINLAASGHPICTIIRLIEEWGVDGFMESIAEAKAVLDS